MMNRMHGKSVLEAFYLAATFLLLGACKGPAKKPMRPPRPARRGR